MFDWPATARSSSRAVQITSLAANAQLHLNGNDAFIEDSTALGSNSALTGLASIGAGAMFGLHNEAAVSTTGALVNDGTIRLDIVARRRRIEPDRGGGADQQRLSRHRQHHALGVGRGDGGVARQYGLDLSDRLQRQPGAPRRDRQRGIRHRGSLERRCSTGRRQRDRVRERADHQPGRCRAIGPRRKRRLHRGQHGAGLEQRADGARSIVAGATFDLENGAAVSTTGALANDGAVYLDTNRGDGGSSLTVAGALTNSGYLIIGNATLSASDEVTAASLDNTGSIDLTGSSANQALLDVTAGSAGFGAAGVLSGNVQLAGDSAIEFASGQITSLAATAQLDLAGNDAFIEDSTALGSNSALTGLASIVAGLRSISTTAPRCRRPARCSMTDPSVSTARRGGSTCRRPGRSPTAACRSRRSTSRRIDPDGRRRR